MSHSFEHNISGTPRGNFFKCDTNIHLDPRINYLYYGGQMSKAKVTDIMSALLFGSAISETLGARISSNFAQMLSSTKEHFETWKDFATCL